MKRLIKRLFPLSTRRGKLLKQVATGLGLAKPLHFDLEYQRWIEKIEPYLFLPVVAGDPKIPTISVVIPFFNTPDKYLIPLMESLEAQSYQGWELVIADASTSQERSEAIKNAAARDKRFKYYKLTENTGISGNTNQGIALAKSPYIAFADHDDTLSPHALNEIATVIADDPQVDILYSDEDKLSDDGRWRHHPLFKPGWSPHLFMNTNYTNHFSVIRKDLIRKVGGLRPKFDGAQDYDLLLRVHTVTEKPLNVVHIPKILYHWREADGSTAADFTKKAYAFNAGLNALAEFIERKNLKGSVENIPDRHGFYQEILEPDKIKKVLVAVCASPLERENRALLERIRSMTRNGSLSVEYMTADSVSTSKKYDATFTVNSFALPRQRDWLQRLVGVLEMTDVQTVSPRVLSADYGRIIDMGRVVDRSGELVPLNNNLAFNDMTFNGHVEWVRDVDEPGQTVVGSIGSTRKNGYHVIWSHVEFVSVPIFGQGSFMNNNLHINAASRIVPND